MKESRVYVYKTSPKMLNNDIKKILYSRFPENEVGKRDADQDQCEL